MAKSIGLLLSNIGSPISTNLKDVQSYLGEFLMDANVIDLPFILRWILVKGIIVNTRARKSQSAYKKIWTEKGSPLIVITKKIANQLEKHLGIPVVIGMRYSQPSLAEGIKQLADRGVKKIIFLPQYPHYAKSSFESSEVCFHQAFSEFGKSLEMSFSIWQPIYRDDDYIATLAKSIQPHFNAEKDHLVFSYHGLPLSHLPKTKGGNNHCLKTKNCCEIEHACHQYCYRHQVFLTSYLVAKKLGIKQNGYDVAFQSRLSKKWLRPFTDKLLPELVSSGKKNLLLVCPSFLVDCLETIEEIDLRLRPEVLSLGAKSFRRVPCLNDGEAWLKVLEKKISQLIKK